MTYEEKREKVIYAIVEAYKFASKDKKPLIDGHNEYFENTTLEDISRILKQFEEEGKLKIESQISSDTKDLFDFTDQNLFTIEIYDIEYFKKLLPEPVPKLNIEDSPIRKFRKSIEYITGTTEKEQAKIGAIESQEMERAHTISNQYFIEYKDNGIIMLNGKIDIGRPQSFGDNQAFFDYVFSHPNQVLKKEEIEKNAKIKINTSYHKILESLGFRRGLEKAFFKIKDDTIYFKNPVTL